MPPRSRGLARTDPRAGRPLPEEAPAPPAAVQPAAVPAPAPAPAAERARSRKFTAALDAVTDARFAALLAQVRREAPRIATREDGAGRLRGGYDASRADVLRALLVVAEDDPSVAAAVVAQVQAHYTATP